MYRIAQSVVLACAAASASASCLELPRPAPPPLLPAPSAEERYRPLQGFDRGLRLGVGHLRAAREEDRGDWLDLVLLPLAATPGGAIAQWLSAGWVVPVSGAAPWRVGSRGTLQTGEGMASLIVLEASERGWLRIRFGPGDEASASGWLHLCDLHHAHPPVVYEPWEEFFLVPGVAPLQLRTGGPRALRVAPAPGEERVGWIPAEARRYALEPLEFKGDWMRARVTAPLDACRASDLKPTVREGWVRWRDPQLGPLVWLHTKAC